MANNENLKPIKKGQLSKEELKKRQSNGGKKSAKVRKEYKRFTNIYIKLLDYPIEKFAMNEEFLNKLAESNPMFSKDIDVKTLISVQVLKKALLGDLAAIDKIETQIGEKPKNVIEQTNTNIEVNDPKLINSVIGKLKEL